VDLDKPENAEGYLEQAIANPLTGGDGLLKKIEILTKKKDQDGVKSAQEILIKNFPKTNAAAEIRWKLAWTSAQNKNYQTAWELTNAIVTDTPNSRYAPRSSFWRGKWAIALGKTGESKKHFQDTITNYPQSYYSWRSSKFLGQDVGDFKTIKNAQSVINIPPKREKLPMGSPTLEELYQIGRHAEALNLWRTEIKDPTQPTVTEQFITGLLQVINKEYFRGITTIGNLETREEPAEKQEFLDLRKKPIYWQALYPLGYVNIINQEAKNSQINPYLLISIIRQESKFDPQIKSIANAVGLMQLIPTTAEETAKQIQLSGFDLTNPEHNVKLGTTYINNLHRSTQNNSLLAIAGYNAGPGNASQWAKKFGLDDPDEFVEKIPFPETESYVKNVLGNYYNYRRIYP
jgi:soluble lytic murein transglycosylase